MKEYTPEEIGIDILRWMGLSDVAIIRRLPDGRLAIFNEEKNPPTDADKITDAIDRHAAKMERCAKLIATATVYGSCGKNLSHGEKVSACQNTVSDFLLATAPAQEKRDE